MMAETVQQTAGSELRRADGGAARRSWPFLVAVLCAVLAAVAGWSDLVLVVPGWVVPHWVVAGLLLAVSVAVRVFRRMRALSRRPAAPAAPAAGRGAQAARWAALALPTGAAVLGIGLGGLGDLGADYRVLEPAGPDGCRAVVRETSFLKAGSGELYAVKGVGLAFKSSSWIVDDGGRPIAAGLYELTWGHEDGALDIHGRAGDPVMPALHGVDCR
ncbi:hypothetical protein [Streptomyces sp. NBC_00091]|uniref:hypothetical protein n=1 Tax=Streptomyces sp. NBC_00091 TaxID=2975648 RepID=UPI0022578B9F|nr:hypothetical protein [Streptomyces sp. NBC_00091]MCX5376213.1 hypothetical protein [Streptomyces sp. NBC_00091]